LGRGKLWLNGATLHVRFLGDDKADHVKVEQWAKGWSEFANIHLANDPGAEIRISFKKGEGSWSYVGRDDVDVVSHLEQATMNLGWLMATAVKPRQPLWINREAPLSRIFSVIWLIRAIVGEVEILPFLPGYHGFDQVLLKHQAGE